MTRKTKSMSLSFYSYVLSLFLMAWVLQGMLDFTENVKNEDTIFFLKKKQHSQRKYSVKAEVTEAIPYMC